MKIKHIFTSYARYGGQPAGQHCARWLEMKKPVSCAAQMGPSVMTSYSFATTRSALAGARR